MYQYIAVIVSLLFPLAAFAQTIPEPALKLIGNLIRYILNPIIAVMFGLAMVYFTYGVVKYIWNPESDDARAEGRQSMLWVIIGMAIMVSVFGIIRFIISSIGADNTVLNYV